MSAQDHHLGQTALAVTEPVARQAAEPRPRRTSVSTSISIALFILLLTTSWAFVLTETGRGFADTSSIEARQNVKRFVERLAGVDEESPAFRSLARWRDALGLAYQTLAMSLLAIGFATIGMLATVMAAARPAGEQHRHPISLVLFLVTRLAYILARSVPELVWALLIVFVVSPGILAGALALGLHNFGVLGRLCAEVVEDLDRRPLASLRASGARHHQLLLYGVLPAALPAFLTYLLYRWEVIIRTTIVVGFVSAAGLGREFRLSLSFFHYSDVALVLLVYVLLVVAVDAASAGLRRLAR